MSGDETPEVEVEEQPKRRGGRKPKFPDPEIGRIVRYVTAASTVRPAIVTGVEGLVVDLTVFNSQGAVAVTEVLAEPEADRPHTWHWPTTN